MRPAALFPRRLAGVTDPLTGFFCVRRAKLDLSVLRPDGFKILLEILVRTPGLRVGEQPFTFGKRVAGDLEGIGRRAVPLLEAAAARFAPARSSPASGASRMVGVTGLAVNTLALAFFTQVAGMHYLWGALAATQVSTHLELRTHRTVGVPRARTSARA